jgi:tetratricopeptide (TPR) repeat protein
MPSKKAFGPVKPVRQGTGQLASIPHLLLWALPFFVLAFAAYWPAVTNGFIWDDDVMLTNNLLMKAPDGLRRIWFSTELSDYFPMTSTTFWIEWRLWGMNPVGYNVLNILLHVGGGILLWRVLLRLKIPGAWLAAILFTLHPVCVASVDWIAERKNTLSLFFYFASLLFYLRFEQEERKQFYWWAAGLFLLALLSKTSVVGLPIILLLCAWWQRGKVSRQDIRRSSLFFALALVLGLVTVWCQLHEVLLGEAKETDNFLTRVLGGSWGLWFYLGKVLWPVNLSMIYPQWDIDPAQWLSYLPGVLWLSALVVFWCYRRSWGRACFFGWGYFTVALAPVLGFFDMDFLVFSQVADHLQYIALPGLIAWTVGVSTVLGSKLLAAQWPRKTLLPGIVATLPILLLCLLTWRQSSVYQDEETLWRDTIRKNPTAWMGYHNLADYLAESRRFEEAAGYYQQALRLKPDHAKSHNNFGNCLYVLGRADEAIDEFLDAIQKKPELAEAHNNLAMAYYQRKQFAQALEEHKKAIQCKPNYAQAYFGAGNSALRLNNLSAALDYYFSAARYNPDNADVQYNIGLILSVRGETNAAVRTLQHALRLNPAHREAKMELKLLLANTDKHQ